TYSLIEPVFDKVISLTGSDQKRYDMFGHSAGSQFAHRFFLFKKDIRIDKVISSNAGWYTMTDFDIGFPYGLKNTAVNEEILKQRFEQHLVIQLGENDNDPNARYLRTADEAMEQGAHRFERGHFFFDRAKEISKEMGIDLGWT